jgi:RHS repeat-associated protein
MGLFGATRYITLNGVDVTSDFSYSGTTKSATSTATITLREGANTLYAEIEDTRGNFGSRTTIYTATLAAAAVTPDGGPPVLAPPSSIQSHAFIVRNTGGGSGTFNLTATCSGALTDCVAPQSVSLQPGTEAAVLVSYAAGGQNSTGRVTLRATHAASTSVFDEGWIDVSAGVAAAGAVITRELRSTDRGLCLTIALGADAAYECADLRIVHGLPATTTYGKIRRPTLLYNSAYARATVRIPFQLTLPNDGIVPNSVTARLLIGGAEEASGTWSGTHWTPGSTRQLALAFDALARSTGLYAFTLEVTRWYPGGPQTQILSDELVVVNRSNSPFGAGWWLAGYEQLIDVGDGRKLWVGGDGSTRVFSVPNGGVRTTTNLDRPETLDSVGTQYRRWLPHRGMVMFDLNGRHSHTRNALAFLSEAAHRTWFVHDSVGRLWRIELPVANGALHYVFSYDGSGKLQAVTAPPPPNGARMTQFTIVNGRVELIRDPDLTRVGFAYGDGIANRITGRSDRRLHTTNFAFGPGNALTSSSLTLETGEVIAQVIAPQETRGLHGSIAISPAVAYTSLDGPRTDVADTTLFWFDRFGAALRIRDPLRSDILIGRADPRWPALATRLQYSNGRVLGATYDGRGNAASSTDSSAWRDDASGRRYATTRYAWDQACDHVTQMTAPEGDSVNLGYNGTTCNLEWREDGRGTTTRVNYRYYDSGSRVGLLRAVQAPSGARDSLEYDIWLANLTTTWTPSNIERRLQRDGIGRLRLKRTQLDSAATLWHDDSLEYDSGDQVIREVSYAPANPWPSQRQIVRNFYNAEGQLDSLQRSSDPNTAGVGVITTKWRYDRAGRTVAEIAPDGWVDSSRYDPAGNVIQQRTRRGDMLVMAYDVLNRLTRRIVPGVVYADTTYAGWRFPFYSNCESTKLCIWADTAVFTYDATGNMVAANNRDALIRRTYNLDGTLSTDSTWIRTYPEPSAGGNFTTHVFGLRVGYDLNGRRSWLKHPRNLAAHFAAAPSVLYDSVAYGYDPNMGALTRVRDVLGNEFRYAYDLNGRVDTVRSPSGHFRYVAYDNEDRRRTIRQDRTSTGHASSETTLTYDVRSKIVGITPFVGLTYPSHSPARHTNAYTGLGMLRTSQPSSPGGEQTKFEDWVTDALGNVASRMQSSWDASSQGYEDAVNQYQIGVGRVLSSIGQASSGGTGCAGSRTGRTTSFRYDQSGNLKFTQGASTDTASYPAPVTGCGSIITAYPNGRASYFSADNKLRVTDQRDARHNGVLQAFEEHRYDALGRRVLRRSRRACPTDDPECLKRAAIQRFVWDGERLLDEIRYPGAHGVTAADLERDTAAIQQGSSTYWGRVLYTHGLGLDQPLTTVKVGHAASPEVRWEPLGIAPHWDWHGDPYAYAVYGPTPECLPQGTYPSNCVRIEFPKLATYASSNSGYSSEVQGGWYGSLLEGQKDASGQLFRRNRFYDPETGRFTQEDPAGLAGGLNAYGFAAGDPANFTDPFGLAPCPPDTDCGISSSDGLQVLAKLDRTLTPVAPILEVAGTIVTLPLQGAMGMGARAITTLGLAARGAATRGLVKEGIYQFTATSGRVYVGQSGNITNRIRQHVAAGRLAPKDATSVSRTEVLGGKTVREVAEQRRINELGGISNLENKVNPIGPNRQHLLLETPP